MDAKCKFCWGSGKIHSSGRNGDPMDNGVNCPDCKGFGLVQVDGEAGDDVEKHLDGCPSGDFGPCDCSRLVVEP